jgi:isocitrate dehydrogenase
MDNGDFFENEKSATMAKAGLVKIELHTSEGQVETLKASVPVLAGEVIDGTYLSVAKLQSFLSKEIADAKAQGVLFSAHLKATMMKVSDPIIFGHFVKAFYKDLFDKHGETFKQLGVDVNNGFGDVEAKIAKLPADKQAEIKADIAAVYANAPAIAMVDSDRGITNLHVPSDVIIDASMPAAIRSSGQMWNAEGKLQDMKAVIPDRCYAGVYQATIEFCKENGAFDPSTMGTIPNVGLMAQKAEEYGSHDKTFEIKANGVVKVIDQDGNLVFEHTVEKGDIWRMCQVKDEPIRDWVKLAVNRSRLSGMPAVFWLDKNRAHDAQLIAKVEAYLQVGLTASRALI